MPTTISAINKYIKNGTEDFGVPIDVFGRVSVSHVVLLLLVVPLALYLVLLNCLIFVFKTGTAQKLHVIVPIKLVIFFLLFALSLLSPALLTFIEIRCPVNGSIIIWKHEKPKNDFMSVKLNLHGHTLMHRLYSHGS